jgi:hypothetical protein
MMQGQKPPSMMNAGWYLGEWQAWQIILDFKMQQGNAETLAGV